MIERNVQVKTVRVRKSPMISSATITNLTRSRANALVERAERQTGSRMAAYEMVAQTVGVSPGWLRKLIKGYEAKEPRATIYENIRAHYEAFCNRVEQENKIDEARLRLLAGNPYAADQSSREETET
jgi:hypothetical protein